jgi:hypothetical protein
VFYEAAEFLFADVVMGAFAGGEVFEGLVFHLQPLQMHDLEVEVALIVNLALQQFHRNQHTAWVAALASGFRISRNGWLTSDGG